MAPVRRRALRRRRRRPHMRRRRKRSMNKLTVWKSRVQGQYMPDRVFVKLRFFDPTSFIQNVGSTQANIRYRMNSAYDADPVVGSTAILGFAELSAIYGSYRIHAMKYDIVFSNLEEFPLMVYVAPLPAINVDPGVNTPSSYQFAMMPYARYTEISSKGGVDTKTLRGYISLSKLVGTNQLKYDDGFAASIGANPTLQLYLVAGAVAPGNEDFTTNNGVVVVTKFVYYTEFYARKDVSI